MKKNIPVMLLVSSLVFTLSGCREGQDNAEIDAPPKSLITKEASALMEDKVLKPYAVDMKSQVNKAIMDLAGRLDVPSSEISVIRTKSVTWRNGSLGCPKKGMSYTQALVPGTLIVLRAGAAEYKYHSGSGRDPFHCANPQVPASATMAE